MDQFNAVEGERRYATGQSYRINRGSKPTATVGPALRAYANARLFPAFLLS